MTTETPEQLRKAAEAFAMKAYQQMPHHRAYALPSPAKVLLGSLARAMFVKRLQEGRNDKEPSPWKEFFGIVEALSKAGCNILQARPNDQQPLPALWTNPLTGKPLGAPKGMTERSLLQKLDPELLGLFDALEKEPYQTVHSMREDEAKRAAMAAVEYNELTHHSNPFRRGDQTDMANLSKRDPLLASFCQQEAKDVELNLFGAQRDLTVRGKLLRDPATSAVVELAEKIHEQWRLTDKAQAAEAITTAERKLAELSGSDSPRPPRMIARIRTGAE